MRNSGARFARPNLLRNCASGRRLEGVVVTIVLLARSAAKNRSSRKQLGASRHWLQQTRCGRSRLIEILRASKEDSSA